MSRGPQRLVLASASPRRRQLLSAAGIRFEVEHSGVDESLPPGLDPPAAAQLLAERKARAVAALESGDALVLGADTLVVHEGPEGGGEARLLGKPRDEPEAAAMLRLLSGSRHSVVTGICVIRVPDQRAFSDVERTWVTMRPILPWEIEAYVASGEWRDKAGGYAIQESADRFVTLLEGGGFDNVVGLPMARTLELLRSAAEG